MAEEFPRPLLSSSILHINPIWANGTESRLKESHLKVIFNRYYVISATQRKDSTWDIEFEDVIEGIL
jgi:hypothetical protein